MLILSTFNSDYLQKPALKYPHTPLLTSLLRLPSEESIEIKYVNKSLIIELSSEIKQPCVILFRLFDFLEADLAIDEIKLEKNLILILNKIIKIKQQSSLPFLVFLCPSPGIIYNEKLKKIEEKYIEEFNKNKIHILSLSNIKEIYGDFEFENPVEGDTHIPYIPRFYAAIAALLTRKLHAITQKNFKLIAVDCDNTLWTGVVTENNPKGVVFEEHNFLLQEYLVKQHENGKIICLCSKNDEQIVIDVFNQREAEMPLKLKHLSKFNKINWKPKSENIKELAEDINLIPDSFRFIDDNPIEINEVSSLGVFCITMPQNLEDYKKCLELDIDEHLIITETDKTRDAFYSQAEIKAALATQFNDPVEYLRSQELGQSIIISKINSEEDMQVIQRVSQLSGKTNQFNIFPESKAIEVNEINAIVNSPIREIFIGRIKDNFSPEDITAVAVISLSRNSLIVNSFFLSCRVFNRGMEYEMLKHIAQFALQEGKKYIKLNFKKSQKNSSASNFLNILNEEKNPKSKYLLDKTKAHVWLHASLKFLLKKLNLYLDFTSFDLDEESILRLSAKKIASIDLDTIIRKALNSSRQSSRPQSNKLTLDSNKITQKYLVELKQMINSLECLSNQFFIDNTSIKSIEALDIRINKLCSNLLGDVGQDKPLVARGLDSLKATELRLSLYEREKIMVTLQMLLCDKTTSLTLINYIKQQEKFPKIVARNDYFYNRALPVSFQQQRIWVAEQQESAGNSSNYHMLACYQYKLSENLDSEKFEEDFKNACNELIKYYDVFGTVFKIKKNELTQEISSPENRKLYFEIKNIKNEKTLEQAIQKEINVPWTMTDKSLIRITVFKDQVEKNYYILFHVHHAIFDAISLANCLNTLTEIYEKITKNPLKSIIFPPQHIDFISDQQKKLKDQAYQVAAFNFWQDKFSQIQNPTLLPTDLYLPIFKPASELIAKRYEFSLELKEVLALKTLVKSAGVTCFSAINALFALLIASYTYQKNVITITALNGRSGHPSYDKMVGFFINLLVQQFDLDEKLQLDEYLKTVQKNFLASQEFQEISFEKIQKILLEQNIKNILLNPALIYQSYPIPTLKLNEEVAELVLPKQPIIFDLRETCRFGNFTLFAQEHQDKLNFVIEYASELFSFSFIQGFAKNFLHTITSAYNNPKQSLQNISVVCDEEREQLIDLGQGPKLNLAQEISLVDRFQEIVRQYSENIALCCGQKRLNFNEVDRQSTNLAHALIDSGVECGNYVGIFLDANYLFFIAELAILKIGAVFIPLSKENPNERLLSIINDAKIKFLIVDDNRKGLFDINAQRFELISIKTVNNPTNLDKELPKLDKKSDEFCVLYTSGSTGTPKGVILQEKGIFRVVESPNFIEVLPGDSMAQTANQAFDAAQLECWLAWNHGANLVLFNKETILNIGLFRNKLKSENITHMWLTAGLFDSHANNHPDLFKDLKYLMVGGDVVHKDTILKVLNFEEAPIIINGYGPTEASIFTLTHTFNKQTINDHNSTLIGLPINETEVEIITALGSKTPLGGIGELFVKGWGVAKGYLNAQLLEKRFAGGKFQTRDLVKCITKDPQIMFMGRSDNKQIKINGNLVALEEIRHCLSLHPDIKQVEVLVTKIGNVNKLVAFYTSNSMNKKSIESTNKMFHSLLSKSLPAYMFPSFYIQLDDFKTSANGKLDKTQFQKFESKLNENLIEEILPKTQNEKAILKIVKNRLYAFPNNTKTNLISFGCDSIATMEIINAINIKFKPEFEKRFKPDFERNFEKNTGVENVEFDNYLNEKIFHANDLYQNPTIEGLADVLIMKLHHETKKRSLRICKDGDSNLPPIIFIHPAGGGLSCFEKLIEQVKFDNICYGIEDPLLDSNQLKLLTMEQMAQNYLSIINNQIQGPFILAGYSFGGMLALEMAAQNESTSENPQNLKFCGLIDTWVVSCISELKQNDLKREVLIYCKEQRQKANFSENSSKLLDALEKLCEHHQEIGFKYKPRKLTFTPVCLLKATILNDKFTEMHNQDENNFLLNFLDKEQFEIREINATHYDILEKVDENSLVELFSDKVNEFSSKKCSNNFNKKLGSVGQSNFFTTPLNTINNDPNFSCLLKPKVK